MHFVLMNFLLKVISLIFGDSVCNTFVIVGFADVLDNEDSESAHVEEIKLAAINLLLDGLELPAPTLTHFLLGFNLQVSQFHEFFSVKFFVYYY